MSLILSGSDGVSDIDGSASTPAIRGADTNTGIFFPAADTIAFAEGGAEIARFNSSGNLGLGTTNPTTKLTVFAGDDSSSDLNALALINGGENGTNINFNNAFGALAQIKGTKLGGGSSANEGVLAFSTAFNSSLSERMRIDSGGNVLVGTTTRISGTDSPFQVLANGGSAIVSQQTVNTADNLSLWNSANDANNVFVGFYTNTPLASRGSIDYNRAAGLVRYNTTSDATLKNLIGDSDKQKSVDILNATKIREYAWKEDSEQKPQIGVIAQELYETYKGAVSVGGEDEEGKYKPWGVDKTAFTFHLIAGWQEHQRIIQEQQAIITDLKSRIEALEAK
jgi:hypothetical protein